MYKDTITLFNRYSSPLGDVWYQTVIHGCDVNMDRANIISKYGVDTTANATLHIKYELVDGEVVIAGKKYLPAKAWEHQTNDILPETITFTPGAAFDFFYVGEINDMEEPISDTAYSPTGFYDYMRGRLDGVFAIESVGGPYSLIPHFEIIGR